MIPDEFRTSSLCGPVHDGPEPEEDQEDDSSDEDEDEDEQSW